MSFARYHNDKKKTVYSESRHTLQDQAQLAVLYGVPEYASISTSELLKQLIHTFRNINTFLCDHLFIGHYAKDTGVTNKHITNISLSNKRLPDLQDDILEVVIDFWVYSFASILQQVYVPQEKSEQILSIYLRALYQTRMQDQERAILMASSYLKKFHTDPHFRNYVEECFVIEAGARPIIWQVIGFLFRQVKLPEKNVWMMEQYQHLLAGTALYFQLVLKVDLTKHFTSNQQQMANVIRMSMAVSNSTLQIQEKVKQCLEEKHWVEHEELRRITHEIHQEELQRIKREQEEAEKERLRVLRQKAELERVRRRLLVILRKKLIAEQHTERQRVVEEKRRIAEAQRLARIHRMQTRWLPYQKLFIYYRMYIPMKNLLLNDSTLHDALIHDSCTHDSSIHDSFIHDKKQKQSINKDYRQFHDHNMQQNHTHNKMKTQCIQPDVVDSLDYIDKGYMMKTIATLYADIQESRIKLETIPGLAHDKIRDILTLEQLPVLQMNDVNVPFAKGEVLHYMEQAILFRQMCDEEATFAQVHGTLYVSNLGIYVKMGLQVLFISYEHMSRIVSYDMLPQIIEVIYGEYNHRISQKNVAENDKFNENRRLTENGRLAKNEEYMEERILLYTLNAESVYHLIRRIHKVTQKIEQPYITYDLKPIDYFVKESIPSYIFQLKEFDETQLPEELHQQMLLLIQVLERLHATLEKYPAFVSSKERFLTYFIPDMMQQVYSYQMYRQERLAEGTVSKVYEKVLTSVKHVAAAAKQSIDEIYQLSTMKTVGQADALQGILGQEGYVVEE